MILQGFQFLLRGGWIMWPLFACAIVAVAVMIERSLVLRREARGAEAITRTVADLITSGNTAGALAAAEKAPGVVGRVLTAGLRALPRGAAAVDQAMQASALRQMTVLNERMGWLDTVITMAPLLGLLGTITGMISAFQVVATVSGASAAPAITGGVAEALIATATGLAVAVTTLPVFNSLSERVRELTSVMEASATEIQSLLGLPSPVHQPSPTVLNAAVREREVSHAIAPAGS